MGLEPVYPQEEIQRLAEVVRTIDEAGEAEVYAALNQLEQALEHRDPGAFPPDPDPKSTIRDARLYFNAGDRPTAREKLEGLLTAWNHYHRGGDR